jgi:uncharacterized protein (DUF1697 family)
MKTKMTDRYIAFLRGINVGGRVVKMERLRQLFTELGFTNVRSYINSGNIFFDTNEKDRQVLTGMIERHLHSTLGYEVPVFLRTAAEVETILEQAPFKDIEQAEDRRYCVIFTDDLLNEKMDLPIHSSRDDMDLIAVNKYEAFVTWHIINGRPPSGRFPDGTLPSRNTTRFFHTLKKILQASKKSTT